MTTTITIDGTTVDYNDFSITVPLSTVNVAPEAQITIPTREPLTANDAVEITIDGTTAFSGVAQSAGTKSPTSGKTVKCLHPGHELFGEEVTLALTGDSSASILQGALDASETGGSYTLTVASGGATLDTYDVENRSVKRVYQDIMDRNGWVWWVDPGSRSITVAPPGDRGQWKSLDTEQDRFSVERFDDGNVETVRNRVTVVGTGDEKTQATNEDSTSISNYGVRTGNSPYNVSYITDSVEAFQMAGALLVPDPLAEGEISVGRNVGDIVQPLVNYTVAVSDPSKDIDATGLVVESQTIEQGRASLQIGQGNGTSVADFNRARRSKDDTTRPGSVYNTEQLADGAITETKITDGSVTTPKLFANAVTAGKIAAATITANEIDTLALGTNQLTVGDDADEQIQYSVTTTGGGTDIPVMEPTADALSNIGAPGLRFRNGYFQNLDFTGGILDPAGAVDQLAFGTVDNGEPAIYPSSDNSGEVGGTVNSSRNAFSRMIAYEFVDADDGTLQPDGGSALSGLAEMSGVPGHVKPDGGGVAINQLSKWLFDVCKEQQQRLERAEERVDELEERIAALEG